MEFFRIKHTIPFMRFSHILNAISLLSFVLAVYWIHGRHADRGAVPGCCADRADS